MKHVQKILAERQTSLFVEPEEKGSGEVSNELLARVLNGNGGKMGS